MKRNAFKKILTFIFFVLLLGAVTVHAEETGGGDKSGGTGTQSEQEPGKEPDQDQEQNQGQDSGQSQDPGQGQDQGQNQGQDPAQNPEIPAGSIQCGDHVYATLDNAGVLTVTGTGPMWNYKAEGESVFTGIRSKIYKIVIKDGVTSVGAFMFINTMCNQLEIGSTVKVLEKRAFYRSYNLTSVKVPGTVLQIGPAAFRECTKLTGCELSEGTKIIGNYAFYKTPLLKSISIPQTVYKIGRMAFVGSGLTEVKIPAGVQTIYQNAFGTVTATIYNPNTVFGENAFAAGSTLIVLTGSTAETFAKANGLNIIYLDCTPEGGIPVAHSWDSGKVTKASTCKEKGVKTYTCTRCGATKTEDIALSAHSYGAWTLTKAPTVFAKGSQRRICSVCNSAETKSVKKATPVLTLNTKKLTLSAGASYKLAVTSKGAGDSVKSWKSSNKKVATVGSAGKVKAKTPGTAKITVTLKSGKSATVKVTVKKVATTSIIVKTKGAKLSGKKVTVKARKSFRLVAKVTPSNSSDKVTFSSSKKSVATVTGNGKVTARKKGTAKITVKAGKKKVKITVRVK